MPNELTNPNNVVTEERLAQFYQQILPYLGGMPDILANKFSKADLYSTDEKLIGRWIDGKPMYQKTVTSFRANLSSGWANILLISDISSDLDTPVSVEATTTQSGKKMVLDIRVQTAGDYLQGYVSGINGVPLETLTIQYTKTTDSAVEIGSDTDYSTTEKIVGTWIDGKPIWQKTVVTTVPNKDTDQYTPIGAEIDTVVDYIAMFKNTVTTTGTNNWIKAGSLASQLASPSTGMVVQINPNDSVTSTVPANTISIRHNATGWGGKPLYVTIQYTKTSS